MASTAIFDSGHAMPYAISVAKMPFLESAWFGHPGTSWFAHLEKRRRAARVVFDNVKHVCPEADRGTYAAS